MTQNNQTKLREWEKEFYSKFDNVWCGCRGEYPHDMEIDKVRGFISSLLEQPHLDLVGKVLELKKPTGITQYVLPENAFEAIAYNQALQDVLTLLTNSEEKIFYLDSYKGKYTIIMDSDLDVDFPAGTITKSEALKQAKARIENCRYYGIPAYIGDDPDLLKAYDPTI